MSLKTSMTEPSAAGFKMLRSLHKHGNHYAHLHGRSAFGGAISTKRALHQFGWLNDDGSLSDKAKHLLQVHANRENEIAATEAR